MRMASRLQYPAEDERPAPTGRMPSDGVPMDIATWDVAPGDTVVVRGTFARAEIRAYVNLIERLHPDDGITVLFLPPGVSLERAARMAEGRRTRSAARE